MILLAILMMTTAVASLEARRAFEEYRDWATMFFAGIAFLGGVGVLSIIWAWR